MYSFYDTDVDYTAGDFDNIDKIIADIKQHNKDE
jgi:hypothetical protein